ncbi:MAG TPA: hypothetical protein VK806_00305 [Bacteroidia bacterium]|jgi:hypothetical protein|nr:hypothetical protein [Bacteroidia bacterium]
MKKVTFSLLGLCIALCCMAQDNDLPSRNQFVLKLYVEDTAHVLRTIIKQSPFIMPDNSLLLYPGEKVFMEIEQKDGVISSVKTVKENLNPDKTLEISFTQVIDSGKLKMSMLKITKNPFPYDLNYMVKIYLYAYTKWVRTTVMPIKKGTGTYETWPDLISKIDLSYFSFSKQ